MGRLRDWSLYEHSTETTPPDHFHAVPIPVHHTTHSNLPDTNTRPINDQLKTLCTLSNQWNVRLLHRQGRKRRRECHNIAQVYPIITPISDGDGQE